MLKSKYLLYLILLRCVFVYSKHRRIYTISPSLSQLSSFKLPENTLFMHTKHKNTIRNSLKSRNNLSLHEDPPDDNYDQDNGDTGDNEQDNTFINETRDGQQDEERENYSQKDQSEDYSQQDEKGENSNQIDQSEDYSQQDQSENYSQQDEKPENHTQQDEPEDQVADLKNNEFVDDFNNNNADTNVKDLQENNFTKDEFDSEKNQQNPSAEDPNKEITNDIAKEEQMKNMNTDAGDMIDSAKQSKEHADELLKQYKEGEFNTETNRNSLPKDDAGNIIITNTTTTPVTKQEQEKVDPLKSIRDATISLYQRAKHKNLPVPDPGDLSTPEKIYTSLNALEYIIDGYRFTKIDVTDKTEQSDPSSENNQPVVPKESEQLNEESEVDLMEPDRFLQLKKSSEDDEDDDEPDSEQNDDYDNEEDFHTNQTNQSDNQSDDEFDKESDSEMNESDSEMNESNEKSKGGTISAHEAMEDLRAVLNQLSSVLEKVVQDNIGVQHVITKQIITSQ